MDRFFLYNLFVICFTSSALFSQTPVGYKFDLNGQPFDGYYDPFAYEPEEKLSFIYNSDSFEHGYFYDTNQNKNKGLIKYENKNIWFKNSENDFKSKIEPEFINCLVLGTDSFFTISNFYYKNRFKEKPELVQYITQIGDVTFAKHYHFPGTGYTSVITETFLAKSRDGQIWDSFNGSKKHFLENAHKYFGHIPYLEKRITSGDYNENDILSIIKTAEYSLKFEKGEYIYYDLYWQEVRNPHNAKYYAQILDQYDSIWTLAYFSGYTKLYEIDYSSFYPHRKNRLFKSFYDNGEIRHEIEYENNEPQKVRFYLENGLLFHAYEYHKFKTEYDETPIPKIVYTNISDSSGQNLIDSLPTIKMTISDNFSNCKYFHTYENKRLVESYKFMDEQKVYQTASQEYGLSIENIQRKFDRFLIDVKFERALNENAQGTILVSFIINPKGYVVQYKIINGIHPQLDRIVRDFIKLHLTENSIYKDKFKPYKIGKEKLYCEVVIPFEFGINRFYRKPAQYYYFHNPFFWNQQFMMQQQMQSIPKGAVGF